jgi:hypothetical protein
MTGKARLNPGLKQMFAARTMSFVVVAFALGFAVPASAQDVSKRARQACSGDAKRLCPKQKYGTEEMRYCMEANGRNLSRGCISALEDDGTIPRGHFRR